MPKVSLLTVTYSVLGDAEGADEFLPKAGVSIVVERQRMKTVSGKITARAKGTCVIYVYAHNGVMKTVKVTVK